MWKAFTVALLLAVAGCADLQAPPKPGDAQAKRFETVADKGVVYIVRDSVGAMLADSLWLDGSAMITTHTGTYYRWEVAPGTHRITGAGVSTASLTLNVEAGKIYFVRHGVNGTERTGVTTNFLERLNDPDGRKRVAQATLL